MNCPLFAKSSETGVGSLTTDSTALLSGMCQVSICVYLVATHDDQQSIWHSHLESISLLPNDSLQKYALECVQQQQTFRDFSVSGVTLRTTSSGSRNDCKTPVSPV